MSQQCHFEADSNELIEQKINFRSNFSHQVITNKHKQQLTYKIQQPKRVQISPTKPSLQSCNIEFQESESQSSQSQIEDNQNILQSKINAYYEGYEEVYRKKKIYGTQWIGNKEYFASTFVDPLKLSKLQSINLHQNLHSEKGIQFNSDFESGNLFAVYKISQYEYDLIMHNDLNTKGNTQWFYFIMSEMPMRKDIKLNIINFRKSDSLFNYGMMPCILSLEGEKKLNQGWTHKGKNIKYFKNQHPVEYSKKYYYTLTFTISTQYHNDTLKIAQSYPYTVSDLNSFLNNHLKVYYKKEVMKVDTLVHTIGKNKIDVLNIKQSNAKNKELRKIIFIMARQHPGETPSSYVCEGLIDFLLSKEKESQFLRKNYQIKVIPMVNPDGVIAGNYRTNLFGYDLNRRWDTSSKSKALHETAYLKTYFNEIAKNRQIALILDLHGHSRKLFSFFYGNPHNSFQSRLFPYLCSKISPKYIKFQDSCFKAVQQKWKTARVQMNLTAKNPNIFTFQTSFYGYMDSSKQKKSFTMENFRELGKTLGQAIAIFEKRNDPHHSKENMLVKKCMQDLKNNPSLIILGEKNDQGSESDPQACEVDEKDNQKLAQSQQYSRQLVAKRKSFKSKKMQFKKEILLKDCARSSRNMKIMSLARINSIGSNERFALGPTSHIPAKIKQLDNDIVEQVEEEHSMSIRKDERPQSNFVEYDPRPFSSSNSQFMGNRSLVKSTQKSAIRQLKQLRHGSGLVSYYKNTLSPNPTHTIYSKLPTFKKSMFSTIISQTISKLGVKPEIGKQSEPNINGDVIGLLGNTVIRVPQTRKHGKTHKKTII